MRLDRDTWGDVPRLWDSGVTGLDWLRLGVVLTAAIFGVVTFLRTPPRDRWRP